MSCRSISNHLSFTPGWQPGKDSSGGTSTDYYNPKGLERQTLEKTDFPSLSFIGEKIAEVNKPLFTVSLYKTKTGQLVLTTHNKEKQLHNYKIFGNFEYYELADYISMNFINYHGVYNSLMDQAFPDDRPVIKI